MHFEIVVLLILEQFTFIYTTQSVRDRKVAQKLVNLNNQDNMIDN